MKKQIDDIFVSPHNTIIEVMKVINEAPHKGCPSGIAVVVDEDKKLLGVVSDGDIRRSIIKGVLGLNSPISEIMTKNPVYIQSDCSYDQMLDSIIDKVKQAKKEGKLRDENINRVLILKEDKTVVDVLSLYDMWKDSRPRRNVCVIGVGFVGLTLGLVLAEKGYKVLGVDVNKDKVDQLNAGKTPFYEIGLDSLLKRHINNNFKVSTKIENNENNVYIISVGTPINPGGEPDLNALKGSCDSICEFLKHNDLIILRSTVPVGVTRKFVVPYIEQKTGFKCGKDFYVSFAPERTIEGKAIQELQTLPQIIGAYDEKSLQLSTTFFRKLSRNIVTLDSLEEAEMVKLINNSFRDLGFSFSNEFSLVCSEYNVDASKVIQAANDGYPRDKIPLPSPGVGGFCLKKDPYLYNKSGGSKYSSELSVLGRKINEYMPHHVVNKINKFISVKNKNKNAKIFLVGFAFKGEPETSDVRNSPTLDVLSILKAQGYNNLYGYDPVVPLSEINSLGVNAVSFETGFKDADVILILNNHRNYVGFPVFEYLSSSKKPVLFLDAWHLFSKEYISKNGEIFYSSLSHDEF